jgi:glycosyltransferase involved in cell wall biosynthesis
MRISAIIPCYNAAPFIQESLRSAASQTLPPHEIIVIDDGSSDDSVARIESSGVPVRLLRTSRAGCAGARLAGVNAAMGDWVAFLDADDIWYPQHLARAAGILAETRDVAYLAHLDCMYHETGEVFAPNAGPPIPELSTGLPGLRFLELFARTFYFSPGSVIQRLDRVREVGGPDSALLAREDVELFLRVVAGRTWTFNPERPWRYRLSTPGAMSANRMRCEQALLHALLKNEKTYTGPVMREAITRTARRVMAMAFTTGTEEDQHTAWETAYRRLPVGFRLFFLGLRTCPQPFKATIHLKRRLQSRR